MLRAVALALHDDIGGNVGDAHRRIGLVDVLSARTASAVSIDAQVGRVDLDLDGFVDFRVDEHARKGGVAAVARIEWRLAHQPVDAGLGAQWAVGIVAGHFERGALDARDFAGRLLQDFDLEAASLAVARVHAHQHGGPVLRLGAALAGLDVDETVVRVHRVGEHAAELHVRHGFLQRIHVPRYRLQAGFVVLLAHHGQQFTAVVQSWVSVGRADHRLQRLAFLADFLRALVVLPEGGVLAELDQLGETLLLGVEVKDTSEARRSAAPDR